MELILLRGRIEMLELEFCRLAAQFAQTDFYDEAGSVSPIDWIRCHLTRHAAADRVAVGERIDDRPESEQALWNGEIGLAHLAVMARTANAVPDRFQESALIEKAKELAGQVPPPLHALPPCC
jgi:hypothetical protein